MIGLSVGSTVFTFAETTTTQTGPDRQQESSGKPFEVLSSSAQLDNQLRQPTQSESPHSFASTTSTMEPSLEKPEATREQVFSPGEFRLPKGTDIRQEGNCVRVFLPEGTRKTSLKQELSLLEDIVTNKGFVLEVKEQPEKSVGRVKIGELYYHYDVETKCASVIEGPTASGVVTIPEKLLVNDTEYLVDAVAPRAFAGNTEITNLMFSDTIKKIGSSAFEDCQNLENVTIGTGVEEIGNNAFSKTGITTVSLPDSVTNLGDSVFAGCMFLQKVQLPAHVSKIPEGTFADCSDLATIDLPSGIQTIGDRAFSKASSLSNVAFPEGVTEIGNAAFASSNLSQVTFPSTLKRIGDSAFSKTNLSGELTIPESLESVGSDAFAKNRLSGELVLPKNVVRLGDRTFFENQFTSIRFSDGVGIFIGNATFVGCPIKDIYFEGTSNRVVKTVNGPVLGRKLGSASVPYDHALMIHIPEAAVASDFDSISYLFSNGIESSEFKPSA